MDIGIHCSLPTEIDFVLLRGLGCKWIRACFYWDKIEIAANTYNWRHYDALVNRAHKFGINILGVTGQSPRWSNKEGVTNRPPDDLDNWRKFFNKLVHRYKDIEYWTVWDAPNIKNNFDGTCDDFMINIMVPAYVEAKHARVKLVGPDLSHAHRWEKWFVTLAGTITHYDVISHQYFHSHKNYYKHLDGSNWFWEKDSLQVIIEDMGLEKIPFWISGTGWASGHMGKTVQAIGLDAMLSTIDEHPWIAKAFIYKLRDEFEGDYGVITQYYKPKKSYFILKKYGGISDHIIKPIVGGNG